jgi:hypothetical protein
MSSSRRTRPSRDTRERSPPGGRKAALVAGFDAHGTIRTCDITIASRKGPIGFHAP